MTWTQILALGTIAIVVQALVWLRLSRALARAWPDRPVAGRPTGPVSASGAASRLVVSLAPADVVVAARGGSWYDPRTRTIALGSAASRDSDALALAAGIHELGHAIQHRDAPWLIALHRALRAIALAGPAVGAITLAGGIVLGPGVAGAGLVGGELALLGAVALVVVERDASRRGLRRLAGRAMGDAGPSGADLAGARAALDVAARSYLLAPLEGLALLARIFSSD